jgi:tRNA dimethylallyltransferase
VGTAKPAGGWTKGVYSVEGIPYHLVDLLELDRTFSAADFAREAGALIHSIQGRGKRPILLGGTGFYFRALIEGLAPLPAADEKVREAIRALALERGRAFLHAELARVDAAAAAKIPANNIARVTRALEVFKLTGKPISVWHAEHQAARKRERRTSWEVIGLDPGMEALDRRIAERCESMLRDGMIGETERALAMGFPAGCPGLTALGYPRVIDYLNDTLSREELLKLLIQDTRQYAKRQRTWFKNQLDVQWKK